jgi:hypothetical protein
MINSDGKNSNTNRDNLFGHKLNVHLEEYKILSDQILKRVEFQQKLLNYQLVAAGIVASIGVRFLGLDASKITNSISVRYFLLLSPLVFLFFSWSFSNHDIMIVSLARYINKKLRIKIQRLLEGEEVLMFEDFLQQERRIKVEKFGILPVLGGEYLLPLVVPGILLTIYIVFFFVHDFSKILETKNHILSYMPQFVLFGVDVFFLIRTIYLKTNVGKNYLRILN